MVQGKRVGLQKSGYKSDGPAVFSNGVFSIFQGRKSNLDLQRKKECLQRPEQSENPQLYMPIAKTSVRPAGDAA